jgi:MFS transporter, putative metabolite:H+ symporter
MNIAHKHRRGITRHEQRMPAMTCTGPSSPTDELAKRVAALGARLDRLPPTWSVWKLIVLLSLGFFFELYDLLYSGYVAPGLVRSGLLTTETHGLFGTTGVASFIAALFAGLFVGTLAGGMLADRYGRRTIFTWSLLWYSIANLVMAFQHTAIALNSWRFVVGLGLGVEMVTIGTYLSELAPRALRGRAFACEQAVGFTAVPLVALLAWLLVPHAPLGFDGWRWVVLIGVQGALFAWWMRRALPESPRWLAGRGELEQAERIVRMLEQRVEAEHGAPLPAPELAPAVKLEGRFRDIWRAPYRSRTLMMTVFNVFQTVGFYGFANWVPTLLIKQGVTVTTSLQYSSLIALAAPVGPLIGLVIADRFERRNVIVMMAGAILVGGLAFAHCRSSLALIACGIVLTLASNIMSYSFHAYQAELFPTAVRARAVAFVYAWSRFSAIFTSYAIAFALKVGGTIGVFVLIAGAMMIVMTVIAWLGPRTRGLALETISS